MDGQYVEHLINDLFIGHEGERQTSEPRYSLLEFFHSNPVEDACVQANREFFRLFPS